MKLKLSNRTLVMCVVTNNCNQACKHCVEGSNPGSKNQLEFEVVNKLFEDINDVLPDSMVSLVGGEATIWPGFFDLIETDAFRKIGFKMLYTNATHLSNSDIIRIKDAGFFEVRVSIDSDRDIEHDDLRGKGTFERMNIAVDDMLAIGVPVTAATVLKKNNIVRIEEIIEYLRMKGIKYVHLLPFYYKGRGKLQSEYAIGIDEINNIVNKNKEKFHEVSGNPYCGIGTAYFKVDYNGDCMIQQGRDKLYLGNLNSNSFREFYQIALNKYEVEFIDCKKCCFYCHPTYCRNINKYCLYGLCLD